VDSAEVVGSAAPSALVGDAVFIVIATPWKVVTFPVASSVKVACGFCTMVVKGEDEERGRTCCRWVVPATMTGLLVRCAEAWLETAALTNGEPNGGGPPRINAVDVGLGLTSKFVLIAAPCALVAQETRSHE